MKKCAVIGGGAMGRQIALNTAIHGYEVAVCESFPAALASLEAWKEEYLSGRVAKGRMTQEKVDVLICGGIGGGAINALKLAFILVVGGAEGDVREVTEAFLNNSLKLRENFRCNHHHHHHGEGHDCGEHSCGEHSCGGSCSH